MSNYENQYEITFWEADPDGSGKRHVVRVPVAKDVFDDYYRPINAYRRTAQNHGRCVCPENKRLLCNMDCGYCPYAVKGDMVSLNETITDKDGNEIEFGDTLPSDEPGVDEEMMKAELLAELERLLKNLEPTELQLCEMVKQGKTVVEMASFFNITPTGLRKRKTKLFERLKTALEIFL